MSLLNSDRNATEQYLKSIIYVVDNIIAEKSVSTQEWQNAFWYVYKVLMWQSNSVKLSLIDYLLNNSTEYVLNAFAQIVPESDESVFVRSYLKYWNKFSVCGDYLSVLFKHADVHYFDNSSTAQRVTIKQHLMDVWFEHIYQLLRERLLRYTIQLIDNERSGMIIDSNQVEGVKHSCIRVQGGTLELEDAYMSGLKEYYPSVIAQHIQQHGIRSYMLFARKKIDLEEANALRYLDPDNLPKVMEVVANVFVESHLDQLLSEFKILLRENNEEYLRILYELVLKTSGGVSHILPDCEEYMQSYGLGFIRDHAEAMTKDPTEYVRGLIGIFERLSHLSSGAFADNPSVLTARDKAFREVVNSTEIFSLEMPTSKMGGTRRVESRCPELLALYYDQLLRKSPANRRLTEDQIEDSLNNVLHIVKYVNSKDICMRYYQSHLIRRLLLEASADSDMEEATIVRLRDVGMPTDLVNRLQQMIQDTKVSKDLTKEFKGYCRSQAGRPGQPVVNPDTFSLMILTTSVWSLQPEARLDISVPTECQDALTLMGEFYQGKHRGRTLTWQYYLSHGILAYTSDMGRFEFELTAHQIVVLYAWDRRPNDALRLEDLSTATGLGGEDMKRTLLSLCQHPKMKSQLLLYSPKETKKGDFAADTEFRLNLKFGGDKNEKSARRRFNLIGRLALSHGKAVEEEREEIEMLRRLRTQEGIIKLMKTRKQMHLNEIYSELVELLHLHFLPTMRFVKIILEWLMEQQFIKRLDTDKNMYAYQV